MTEHPLISLIIPAFNAERFLAETIESILAQGIDPIEIVVIDDGSSDATAAVAARFGHPVRCISQPNSGAPAARNSGLAAAKGEVIGFCDADDSFLPGALRLQLEKLLANPEIDVVVGRYVHEAVISKPGEPLEYAPVETSDDHVLQLGVSMFRRRAFDKVGGFDEELRQCDDWDWFMRARELQVPILFHTTTIMRHRLHDSNITRDQDATRHYTALMLKRSLDRRRKAGGAAQSLRSLASQTEQGGRKDALS